MSSENSAQIIGHNLFGDTVYHPQHKRGRPRFEWTSENSNKVSMLLAMGWNNDRIASAILDPRTGKAISAPTLKRYFRSELQVRTQARDMLFARQLTVALEKAFEGNVGAMRLLDKLIEKNDAVLADGRLKGDKTSAPEAKPQKLGKKEAEMQSAQKAFEGQSGSHWQDDLTPGFLKDRVN